MAIPPESNREREESDIYPWMTDARKSKKSTRPPGITAPTFRNISSTACILFLVLAWRQLSGRLVADIKMKKQNQSKMTDRSNFGKESSKAYL